MYKLHFISKKNKLIVEPIVDSEDTEIYNLQTMRKMKKTQKKNVTNLFDKNVTNATNVTNLFDKNSEMKNIETILNYKPLVI